MADTDKDINDEIVSTLYSNNFYAIYIDNDLEMPDQYRKAFDILQKANTNDAIKIIMNCYGGYTATAIQFINMMQQCQAYIITELYTACSSGALITLASDEIIPKFGCKMMFHSASFSTGGKIHEVEAHSTFINKWDRKITEDICKGFLTTKEIEGINNGKDIWLGEDDIKKRLKIWKPPILKRK